MITSEHIPFDLLIEDEGVAVARRKIINLKGAGVTATDDPTNDRVNIEIPGGGGAHAADHQNGGADEVNVAGLSGELADNQPPKTHTASHQSGGGDAIKLDDLAAPDDNTDLDVSITCHGLVPKLPNDATKYLNGVGGFTVPAGGGGGNPGEGHITILPWSYDSIAQGTWGVGISSSAIMCGWITNSSNADADELHFKVYLDAGTYSFRMMVREAADRGIVDIYLDAVEIASFDWYAAAGASNVVKTETGIVVGAAGLYTLKLKIDGKNGSSSGYKLYCQYIALWRTA